NLYACVPIHRGPILLLFGGVLLTQRAPFAVTVLVPPLDDFRSWLATRDMGARVCARIAFKPGHPFEQVLIDTPCVICVYVFHCGFLVFWPSPLLLFLIGSTRSIRGRTHMASTQPFPCIRLPGRPQPSTDSRWGCCG